MGHFCGVDSKYVFYVLRITKAQYAVHDTPKHKQKLNATLQGVDTYITRKIERACK